jgi:hypothetical protein
MPTKTKLEISSFIKGLITEASALTFPDSASIVDENFVLLRDGSRKRRLGMDYEDDYIEEAYFGSPGQDLAVSIHVWKNPVQEGFFDIIVVQTEDVLRFFKSTGEPISGDQLNGGLPVTLPVDYTAGTKIRTSSLRGQLVVTYQNQTVLIFDYDESTDTISFIERRLEIRDLFGIESPYEVSFRPTIPYPLTPTDTDEIKHVYNLRNQGWPTSAIAVKNAKGEEVSGSAVETVDPIILNDYISTQEVVSDADVLWRAKSTAASSPEAVGAYSRFDLLKQQYGDTPAPKGKFVIDLFNRSTTRQAHFDEITGTGTLLLPDDISQGYISSVAAYAGRFFYSIKETGKTGGDQNTPKLSSTIFFSQVVKGNSDITSCYAEADPTSEFIFDPIDTDGGFIVIPSVGEVLSLVPLGNSLFVFGTNGVWEIHGGEQAFSATNQNLTKTTSIGSIGYDSIVVAETNIMYWTDSGIYAIGIDSASYRGAAINTSNTTIQTLYLSIPRVNRVVAKGIFDEVDRKVRWLYNNSPILDLRYRKELVLDIDLGAFYTNEITPGGSTGDPGIVGFVAAPQAVYLIGRSTFIGDLFYSFGRYKNTSFKDYNIYDAPATLVTGYLTGGTASTDKRIKSLVAHFNRTEQGFVTEGGGIVFDNPSACLITTMWDWTDHIGAGRWGVPYQAYRLSVPYYPTGVSDPFNYGYTVITSKTGVRGKGGALSIKFQSVPEHDLHLLGWGLEIVVDDSY